MKKHSSFCLGLGFLAGISSSLCAAPLTWDVGVGDGAAITDGGGTWTTGTGSWNSGSGDATWTTGDSATFTGAVGGIIAKSGTISQTGVVFNGTAAYTVNGTGSITGAGALTKSGTSILTLATNNSYGGGTILSAGTIKTTSDAALSTGGITLNDANTGSSNTTFSTAANTGGSPTNCPVIVANQGTGTTTLEITAQNSQLGFPSIQLNKATTIQSNYNGGGGGYVGKYDSTSVVSGNVGTLTLRALGTGKLYMNGNNTFTGTVSITQGNVVPGHANAFGGSANSIVMSGTAILDMSVFNPALVIGDLTGTATNTVNRGASALTISSANSAEFAGVITGSGTVTKSGAGTQTLSGANTYTGATTINGGTLVINGSTHGSSTVTVNTSGKLSGTGTINGSASISAGGTLAPGVGGIGTLHVIQNLTLAGVAEFEVNKSGATITRDQVDGIFNVTYGGTLKVTASGDPLAAGDTIQLFVINGGSHMGGFSTFDLPVLGSGLSWDTGGLMVDGSIKVVDHVGNPTFNPSSGGYVGAQSVTITSDGGSTIYYTTNGSTPTASSPSGPSPLSGITVPVNSTMTIKAFARKAGQADSPVVEATYVTVDTPTWTFDGFGSWADPLNWESGVIPNGSGAPADFSTLTLTGPGDVSLDSSRTVGSMVFGDQGDSFGWVLGAGTGGSLTLDNGANSPVIAVNNQATVISAPISGGNGFVKSGAGTLTLSSANDYTGNAILSAGTLKTAADAALSTGSITLNDANTGSNSTTLSTTANTGASAANNTIIVANQGTGTTTLELAAQNSQFGGASIQLNRATTVQSNYNGAGGAYLGKYDSTSVISGNVGTLTLRALGTGKLYVTGNNTFTGQVDVTQGTVAINHANALGGTNPLNVAGSATLNTSAFGIALNIGSLSGAGTIDRTGQALTINSASNRDFDGVINGSGTVTKSGVGTQTLSGANTYTGTTTVSAGTLALANTGSLAFKIGANGVNNRLTGAGTVTLDGSFQIDLSTADTTAGNTWTLVDVATLTETFGATFAVAGFTQSSDVWTKTDSGHKWTFTEATGVLTVASAGGYSSWASTHGIAGEPSTDDHDHDGLDNGTEYALGLDPTQSSASPGVLSGGTLTFTKGADAIANGDVTYVIQESDDLGVTDPWTAVVTQTPPNNSPTISHTLPTGKPKVFARLLVTLP